MIAYAEILATRPTPQGCIFAPMTAPPDFTPPKSAICRPYPLNVESRPYAIRNGADWQKAATQSKYTALMSKTKWTCAPDIAFELNISSEAVKQTMRRAHMAALVIHGKVVRNGRPVNAWRLK